MHIFSDKKLENYKLWTFGIFLWLCITMHMKKCITIHLLLGNIRPRIKYCKMQILWSFQGGSPLDLHQDSTMELLEACNAWIHSNVLHNDRRSFYVVPMTSQTKRQKKYDWGGAPLIRLPPQQLHSHHATGAESILPQDTLKIMYLRLAK